VPPHSVSWGNPPATYQLGDGEAMVDAAIAGLGLVLLPSALVRSAIQQGRLRAVLDDFASSVEVARNQTTSFNALTRTSISARTLGDTYWRVG
jgi:DNA-binding transcriptional LysR family regulator